MYFHVGPDKATLAELDKWLTEIERRTARTVAASCLTTLARKGRKAGITNLAKRLDLPKSEARKRVRVFRANPKRPRITAGIITGDYNIPEIFLNPRQTGHPGRPRYSGTKEAKRARKRRKAQGAKRPRPGGVKSKGRQYPGAWIGNVAKDGAGPVQVIKRTGKGRAKTTTISRPWKRESRAYFRRATSVLARGFRPLFDERMRVALAKRGQTRALTFLDSVGEV